MVYVLVEFRSLKLERKTEQQPPSLKPISDPSSSLYLIVIVRTRIISVALALSQNGKIAMTLLLAVLINLEK